MKTAIWAAAMAAMAMPAAAATVTVDFDEAEIIGEAGYTFTLLDQGFVTKTTNLYWGGDDVLIHDDGAIIKTSFRRENFGLFSPKGLDLAFYSSFGRTGPGPRPDGETSDDALYAWLDAGERPQLRYRVTGSRPDGTKAVIFAPGTKPERLAFGAAFENIKTLTVEVVYPKGVHYVGGSYPNVVVYDMEEIVRPGQIYCFDYCAQINIDNLTAEIAPPVAPVPLPAGAVLLGGALAMLGAVRRLRKGAIGPI